MSMGMGILELQSMSARASEDSAIRNFIKTKQPLVEDAISVEDVASACVYLLANASHAINRPNGRCRSRLKCNLFYVFPLTLTPAKGIMLRFV